MNNTNYMIIDLATQQPTIKPIGDYLFARQGDNRRPLPIWFQQSGQPFALDGYTVEWAQKNADGTPLVVSGTTISGASVGQVVFFFPANAFGVAGTVLGHFNIKKVSDGTLISSIDLSFDVKPDNVLMNIDTTPFMNDWETFKANIQTQTDGLRQSVTAIGDSLTATKQQADEIKTSIDTNQVAKLTDLNGYVSKNGNATIAGALTADNFNLSSGSDLVNIRDDLRTTRGYNTVTSMPLKTGLYKYDMATWSETQTKPPVLLPDLQKGLIRVSAYDSANITCEWLSSGWIQRQINGNWNNWYNYQGVTIYNGTATPSSSINLAGKFDVFTHFWVEVYFQSNHYFGWIDNSDLRFVVMGSKGQQTSLAITGSFTANKLGIQFSEFKSRANGYDSVETGTATIKIVGYKY